MGPTSPPANATASPTTAPQKKGHWETDPNTGERKWIEDASQDAGPSTPLATPSTLGSVGSNLGSGLINLISRGGQNSPSPPQPSQDSTVYYSAGAPASNPTGNPALAGTPALSYEQWMAQTYGGDWRNLAQNDPDTLNASSAAYRQYVAQDAAQKGPSIVNVPTGGATGPRPVGTVHDERTSGDAAAKAKLDALNAQDTAARNEQFGLLRDAIAAMQGRAAPVAPGAAQIGPAAQAAAAQAQAAQLARVGGPEALGVSAALPERSAVGARQMSLADLIGGRANDENQRAKDEVMREQQAQEAAQMSLAASASPALRALALANAQQNIGTSRAGAAREIASRNQAYRADAMKQLTDLLGQARGADITESGNIANAENAARALTAQLGTQASIAGSQIGAQQAGEQAQLTQGVNLANAGAANAANMFNASAANAANAQNAAFQQQAGQFGANLGLQAQGQQDQGLAQLIAQRLGLLGLQQQGTLTKEQIAAQQQSLQQQLQQAWNIAQLQSKTSLQLGEMQEPSIWDRIFGVIGGALPVVGSIIRDRK